MNTKLTTKDRIDQALGISGGKSIDEMLDSLNIEAEEFHKAFDDMDTRINSEIAIIDNFCNSKPETLDKIKEITKKEFPNDLSVLHDLMYALDAEDEKENADEIIECGEKILAESTDNSQRGGAIQCLSSTYYYAKGDAESAKKYARMANSYAITANQMMPNFLEGDEAVELCQSNVQMLVDMIWGNTCIMCWKGNYSSNDRIKAFSFVIDCFNLLWHRRTPLFCFCS